MAITRITALTAITGGNLASGDQFVVVDVSDTTMDATGTTKKIAKSEIDTLYQPLDSDLTTIAAASNGAVLAATTASFTTADETKLDGIEAAADVTDAANVAAAGAVMATTANAKGDLFAATADNTVTRLAVGTNGQVLTADSAESTGMKWATASSGGGASMGIGYTSRSTYYSHGFPGKWTSVESYNWATGYVIAYPVVVGRSCSIDRIGTAVTTGVASATMWVGIYNPDGTAGAPGTLVSGAVSAELDCSTTGTKETTISVTLSPGVYWFVSQTGATATHKTRTASAGAAYHALPTSAGDRANYVMYTTRTAAVLPSDLSATTFNTYSDTELPHGVMVRFA